MGVCEDVLLGRLVTILRSFADKGDVVLVDILLLDTLPLITRRPLALNGLALTLCSRRFILGSRSDINNGLHFGLWRTVPAYVPERA